MEDFEELKTFFKVWFIAIVSLCYCYFIPNRIPNGFPRLLSLLPVITVFFILPLPLSAVHLAGPTVFYLVWLGNFKLLLFAFNRGPLASTRRLQFIDFISIALLPINPKHADNRDPDRNRNRNRNRNQDQDLISVSVSSHKPILLTFKGLTLAVIVVAYRYKDKLHRNLILGFYCCLVYLGVELVLAITALASTRRLQLINFIPISPKHAGNSDRDPDPDLISLSVSSHKPILLTIKALILAVIVSAYQYRENLNPNVILGFYCCHVYLGVELLLAITAFIVRFIFRLRFEIEPQFNEPYLATSLQDFWGRRWNLMVTRILRPAVYDPIREISSPVLGNVWSRLPAIFATFVVSGLMHELIYLYFTRVRPTWEVTWFFVLHGLCTAVEVAVKKAVNGRFWLHRAVSGVVTVAFVAVTGVWLFLPQILRNGVDIKAINEYSIAANFLMSKLA